MILYAFLGYFERSVKSCSWTNYHRNCYVVLLSMFCKIILYVNQKCVLIASVSTFPLRTSSCSISFWLEPFPGPFVCPDCHKVYAIKSTLARHLKYECSKQPRFGCALCFYRGYQKTHVVSHLMRKHSVMHKSDVTKKIIIFDDSTQVEEEYYSIWYIYLHRWYKGLWGIYNSLFFFEI